MAAAYLKAKKPVKEKEDREGEYMTGESDNVFAITTIYGTKAQAIWAAEETVSQIEF